MRRALLLVIAAMLYGCGLKGPLYLPESKPPARQPAKPSATPATAPAPAPATTQDAAP